jgi:hypothetical protein
MERLGRAGTAGAAYPAEGGVMSRRPPILADPRMGTGFALVVILQAGYPSLAMPLPSSSLPIRALDDFALFEPGRQPDEWSTRSARPIDWPALAWRSADVISSQDRRSGWASAPRRACRELLSTWR